MMRVTKKYLITNFTYFGLILSREVLD